MNFVYFNISLHGKHLFRTDEYLSCDVEERHYTTHTHPSIQAELCKRFPASEGFTISRNEKPNCITMTTLDN